MKADALPSGAWESLLPRALMLTDDISKYGGIADPFWTFGGGTVLMFRYRHRLSKDIDIFVPDPQYLGVASRTIIWSLVKQVRVGVMPLFHGLHRRTALER